jgi:hypothetical protein
MGGGQAAANDRRILEAAGAPIAAVAERAMSA